ncbi:MAG: DUF4265 domain-containing protein [Chthonomonadales bacterium]
MSLDEKFLIIEKDPKWRVLDLPIDGDPEMVEEVLVEALIVGQFRVASSPGMILGLAADDIIEADSDSPDGYRLIKRGQNVAVHVFCEVDQRDEIEAALNQTIGQIGGELDGKMGETGLCYTIPVQAGFTKIEYALSRVVRDDWTYSNVHDLETGELLNWWLSGAA